MKRLLLLFLGITLCSFKICAQTTHAHATSRHWHGLNIDSLYESLGSNDSKRFYLYNVGTGRFVIEGGNWGMEGRLFHEDFGREMYLRKRSTGNNGLFRIDAEIVEQNTSDKRSFICNVPMVSKQNQPWSRGDELCFTTIMDGPKNYENWRFVRVENDEAGFYTYYMYQNFNNSNANYTVKDGNTTRTVQAKTLNFYLGAAYGEWCSDGTTVYPQSGKENKKGNGFYVHIDDDRTCWTTAGQATSPGLTQPFANTTEVEVNGDMVPIQELYQWRIIPEEEFIRVLNEEVVGLNPSISSLVPDRDFTRNSEDFFTKWINEGNGEGSTGRYGYTWGQYEKSNNQQGKYFEEPWDNAVKLKEIFDDGGNVAGMKYSKFGYMSMSGKGKVYTEFELPKAGWYQITASAISFAPANHPAYMFAKVKSMTEERELELRGQLNSAFEGFEQTPLIQKTALTDVNIYGEEVEFPTRDINNSRKPLCLAIGQILTYHPDDYLTKFWIYISPDDFNNGGDNTVLQLGFRKDFATQSSARVKDNKNYYYDTDWVCVDNIKVSYMGLAPAFFYEDEESLRYLQYIDGETNNISASPNNRYSGALSLKRSFKKGQWNSFAFPIPLTGEQVRYAFGEDAKLAVLHSVGGISHRSSVIDFKSVELKPTDPLTAAVEPGKFYLLWPTVDPTPGADPNGIVCDYYTMGRNFFSVNPADSGNADYKHPVMDPATLSASQAISSHQNENDGTSFVNYVQTKDYSNFSIGTDKQYNGTAETDIYATKGSYVVSNGTIYELNRDTKIRGFRGWIELDHSVFDDQSSSVKMSLNGVVDGDIVDNIDLTTLMPVPLADDTAVYDLAGRKVGTLGDKLPKGIYIVGGKKMFVK